MSRVLANDECFFFSKSCSVAFQWLGPGKTICQGLLYLSNFQAFRGCQEINHFLSITGAADNQQNKIPGFWGNLSSHFWLTVCPPSRWSRPRHSTNWAQGGVEPLRCDVRWPPWFQTRFAFSARCLTVTSTLSTGTWRTVRTLRAHIVSQDHGYVRIDNHDIIDEFEMQEIIESV